MVKTSEARDEVDVPMVGVEDEVNAMGKAWVLPPHCFFWVGSELDSLPQIRVGPSVVQICISFCDIHLNTPGLEAAGAGGCSAGADASQQNCHNPGPGDMH